ncbi:unnamed protein product [Penicillium viridicatum]
MGCKSSVLVRPQVLPQITVSLVWVSQQEIEVLVNATETLEITRREPGMTWTTPPTTTDASATLPTDEPEQKEAESTAGQTRQGQVYYIQTKALDRPVNYTNQICLIVLPFGLQFLGTGGYDIVPGLQFVAHHAVVVAVDLFLFFLEDFSGRSALVKTPQRRRQSH